QPLGCRADQCSEPAVGRPGGCCPPDRHHAHHRRRPRGLQSVHGGRCRRITRRERGHLDVGRRRRRALAAPRQARRDHPPVAGGTVMTFDPTDHLPDDLLDRIRERAPIHDHENTFPEQDLAELRDAGYLKILVPAERGGAGLGLEQAAILQQRLATASPATALAINMHLVWTGVAKVFSDRGVPGLEFVQDGAAAGEVFAFGISEGGNDLVLFGSDTDAVPAGGGSYAFTGTKIFTSLTPVWTQLGLHGLDTTSADAPKLVFAFINRSDAVETLDDWDTLGMRATQSRTTRLNGAVAASDRIVRRIDPGPGPDPI